MTNLFKKTLVAGAIMAAAASVANAATISTAASSDYSRQGAASETSIALPDVTITLGDEYAVNDRLVLKIVGATVTDNNSATITDASGTVTVGRLTSDANDEVVFRLTNIALDAAGDTRSTNGVTLVFSGVTLDTASVLDGSSVSVSYVGRVGNSTDVIEETAATAVIEVSDQFALGTVTPLGATIDVNADRQQFTTDTSTTTEDTLGVSTTETTGLTLAATATTVTHTLFGDFSFVDADNDGAADYTFTATGTDDTFGTAFDATFSSVTITQAVVGGSADAATVTVTVPGQADGNPVLEAQDFSATVALSYTDNQGEVGQVVLANEAAVGSWDLNGAQVFVPYLPVGFAGVENRVILANDGNQNGEIEVEAFAEDGTSYGPAPLNLTLNANSNLTITGAQVAQALGITGSDKLSVTFTINAPKDDVTATGYTQKAGTGRQLITVE